MTTRPTSPPLTVRRLLKALRSEPSQARHPLAYKSAPDPGTGLTAIYAKPDFSRVPYDRLKDYWMFQGLVVSAVVEDDGSVRFL